MKQLKRNSRTRPNFTTVACLLAAVFSLGLQATPVSAQGPDPVDEEITFAAELVKLGMSDYAEKIISSLLRSHPEAADRVVAVNAEIAIDHRDFAAVEALLAKLPAGSAKKQAIQLALANALYSRGESGKAIAIYNEFFKAYGDKIPEDEDILRNYIQAAYTQATMAKHSGNLAGAVNALRRVIRAKPPRDVVRTISVELGNALIDLARKTEDAEKKEALLKEAEALAEQVTFGGNDLLFGQAIGVMANARAARGNRAAALKLIEEFYSDVAAMEAELKKANVGLAQSPLAPLRFLRGELHLEDAKTAFAGGDKQAGLKALAKAGSEFYNVFIKYSGSEWSDKAGLKYNEADELLNQEMGKHFKAQITSKGQQGVVAQGKLTLGDKLFKNKEYTQAIEEYLPILNAYPEVKMAPGALHNLALAYAETEQPLYARMVIAYLAERFSDNEDAATQLLRLGSKFYKAKQETLYHDAYTRFASAFPDHDAAPQVLYLLAETARQKGDNERSNELYERIAEKYPGDRNYLKAVDRIAFSYFKAEQYDKAADYFGRFIEASRPGFDQAQARFRRAYALAQEGSLKEALSEFNQLKADLSARGSDNPYRQNVEEAKIDELLEQTVLNLAQSLARIPADTPDAKEFYARAVTTYGEFLEAFPASKLAPTAMYGQGKLQVQLGNFAAATATFNKLAEKYPASSQGKSAYYSLVQASVEAGQAELAKEAVDKMLAKSTEYSPEEFIRVGQLMLENKFYAEAKKSMEIVSRHPKAQENSTLQQLSLFGMAQAENKLGDYTGSAATLAQLLEKYPRSALFFDIKLLRADSLRGEGRLEEAKQALKEVYTLTKQRTDGMKADMAMGRIHAAGDDREAALASFMKVVFFGDPNDPTQVPFINESMIEALEMAQQLNRYDKVKELCESYISYFPRGDRIKEIRKLLAQAQLKVLSRGTE